MKTASTIALSLAILLSACSTQTALVNGKTSSTNKEEMQTFFVSGLGQTQSINAATVCGGVDKVVKVERTYSPMNWGLSLLTSGIYTPYDAKVYCN
jgi:hypothetical protein